MTGTKEIKAILKRWPMQSRMASFSTIEHCFGLNQKTLEGWLSGKIKSDVGVLALLRMIDTYPWLVAVAARDFEKKAAEKLMVIAGLDVMRAKLLKELVS